MSVSLIIHSVVPVLRRAIQYLRDRTVIRNLHLLTVLQCSVSFCGCVCLCVCILSQQRTFPTAQLNRANHLLIIYFSFPFFHSNKFLMIVFFFASASPAESPLLHCCCWKHVFFSTQRDDRIWAAICKLLVFVSGGILHIISSKFWFVTVKSLLRHSGAPLAVHWCECNCFVRIMLWRMMTVFCSWSISVCMCVWGVLQGNLKSVSRALKWAFSV